MTWIETHEKLRAELKAELHKKWGSIGEVDAALSRHPGFLSNFTGGRNGIRLDLFLKTLEALGVDAGIFFARTLGGRRKPEDDLPELAAGGDEDRPLRMIAAATRELLVSEPPAADPVATAGAAEVAELAARGRIEQQRRLRDTRKYRTHAFALAYLEHLDSLRYDHADEAARLVTKVAVTLIPALPGPRRERLALQSLALGVFGSARRLKGHFPAAARAFHLALEVARGERLMDDVARLLQRASYLLRDHGRFEHALDFLREALEIYVDLGSRVGIGKTLVDRGMMLTYLGHHEATILVLRRALSYLEDTEADLPRSHLAAYQYLAYSCEQLGELDEAEKYLEQGARAFATRHAVDSAKLRWLQGSLAIQRGHYRRAEALLREARRVLAETEKPGQQIVISVDLIQALLAQGKGDEAYQLARDMASLLERFPNDRFAEAAVVKLVRAALEGQLDNAVLREAREMMTRGAHPSEGALPVLSRWDR